LETGHIICEVCERWGLHNGVSDALESVANVGRGDGSVGCVVAEARVCVETNPFFESAPVGDFAVGARFTQREGFEEAGLKFVGVSFERVILEQALLDGFEDAPADVVV
jgi:hypothetical protein